MECDFAHWGRSPLARCTKRPSDCGESAERSTTRRTLGERSGCTLAAGNSAFGGFSECVANSVARAHAIRSKEATVRSSAVGRRSLARASRHSPGSLAAAAGRSPNARRSGQGLRCKLRGTLASRSDRASPKIGGAGENVVARIVSVGAEVVAGPQSGVCLWHDLHQPHCALWRNGARISTAFDAHNRPNPVRGNTESLRGLRDEG